VEIQKELKTRNAELPENRKMEFRIGVNLGDVIEDGEQILGDGVNIAARLESLSEAGGICISGTAFDQVRNKLELGYDYLGEQSVKNIALPVRVYRVLMEPEAVGKVIGEKKAKPKQWQKTALIVLAILIVVVAAVVIWSLYFRPAPPLEIASKEKMAFPLPDVPSIAVLPFVNMSGDPKQEFFSDGVTEGIITALSRNPYLLVIARSSTFAYKGKPVKVKQVSEELGVRYVLEGSIQRSEDRVRITAQLIDAVAGNHIWAERYDRDLKEIFALQDEITMKVLAGVQAKVPGEVDALTAEKLFRGKRGLDCYLKYLEAMKYLLARDIESIQAARRIASEIIEMCPESSVAYSFRASIYINEYWLGWGKSPQESIEKGIEMAQKALAIDGSNPFTVGLLGFFHTLKGETDEALAEGERGITLDPSGEWVHLWYSDTLRFAGRPEEAIAICQKIARLSPFSGITTSSRLGQALRDAGRYEEAVSAFKKTLQLAPNNILAHADLAATYSLMGQDSEAGAEGAEVLRLNPKFSFDSYAKLMPYKDQSQTDKIIDALRKAGLK
jgi:adenylate cyclase